ncbi:UNVERIFIED_CONTAM: hypothetical protein Sangu_0834100, partial [Sesamum angustifolium]
FSPIAKAVTVRLVLVVASSLDWPVHQVDINNTFLHGFLDEDIYMVVPEGSSIPLGKVCKLRRSLYVPVRSRHSLTGYCICLGQALIFWKTKKRPTVAHSTIEVEYRSLGATTCELKWISYLLHDLRVFGPQPIPYSVTIRPRFI